MYVTKLGDYFVGMQLRVWLADERTHVPVRAELREAVKRALDGAGIIMPYETVEVIQRNAAQRVTEKIDSGRGEKC